MSIILETPLDWSLDQAIEHDKALYAEAAHQAAQPNERTRAFAESFLCTTDLTYTPVPALRSGERMWAVTLPASTGRRLCWGMELLLVQRDTDRFLCSDGILVRISHLRRLVDPRRRLVRGRIPVIGALLRRAGHDSSIAHLGSRVDLDRYTKRVEG